MSLFTPEELEELRRADAELDEDFRQTQEEIEASRERDRQARRDKKDKRGRKIADQQRAYREANREEYNAYMREYMRRRREQKKAALRWSRPESGRGNTSIPNIAQDWRKSQCLNHMSRKK